MLLSVALLTALMATGQPREVLVSGRVFDVETGQPLSQVNIALDASLKGTTTNRGGGYQLRVKQRDSIGLSFRFVGYETHFKSIPWPREGKNKDTLIVNIGLRFQPVVLPPTSIIGNRPPDTVAGSNRFS
ncbi:MAG: carboxypeptidase-like regulatory domain-containing protein, partial [Bacteroidota bacterium]